MPSWTPPVMAANGLIWALLLVWIFLRQIRPRPVSSRLTVPVILVVVGLLNMVRSVPQLHAGSAGNTVTSHLNLSSVGIAVVVLFAGVLLGVARGFTVRLWHDGTAMMRQGTWITVLLWLVAIAVRLTVDLTGIAGTHTGGQPTYLLLYLGLTLGAQQLTVARRADAVQ